MKFRHGAYGIDVPEDWEDHSTLLFVGRRTNDALPTVTQVDSPAELLSITFVEPSDDSLRDPEAFQNTQIQGLAVDPTYRVLHQGSFESPLGKGWKVEQEMRAEGRLVQQLSVAIASGPLMVLALASVNGPMRSDQRVRLLDMLTSLDVERD